MSGSGLAVVATQDKYVENLWTRTFERHKVPVTSEPSAVGPMGVVDYRDYDEVDFEARAESKSLVYSYVFRKGLIRKNYLAHTVAQYVAKHPGSILKRAVPEAFNLSVDYAEFLDDSLDEAYELRQEIEQGSKTWILKPALSDGAYGIRIFKTVDGLQQIFDSMESEDGVSDSEDEKPQDEEGKIGTISSLRQFVVQEYVENPLLIDGRKFHLRVYVLAAGAISVYVYRHVLALFASEKYQPPSGEVVDMAGHITNTCALGTSIRNDSVRLLEHLGLPVETLQSIMDQISDVVRDLFEAAVADRINFQPLPNAFEFYGLDFMVDSEFGVKFIEANAYPDFKQTGSELDYIVEGFFDAAAQAVVLPYLNPSNTPYGMPDTLHLVLHQDIYSSEKR